MRQTEKARNNQRREDLDLLKGLAIVLVVLGHIVATEPPPGNAWYGHLKFGIYRFHMPLFMALSGLVFALSQKNLNSLQLWISYVQNRTERLLLGFATFATLIWLGKMQASRFVVVDNLQEANFNSLIGIFLSPTTSVAGSLWFVYVLFQFSIIFAVALKISNGRLGLIFIGCATLHVINIFAPLPTELGLRPFAEFALYFCIGIAISKQVERWTKLTLQYRFAIVSVFFASFLLSLWSTGPWAKLMIGTISIPAVYALVNSVPFHFVKSNLLLFSQYSLTIYLLNTILIGLSKGLLLKLLSWNGTGFLLFFPILFLAGLIGPIFIHKFLLSHFTPLARITK